MLLSDTIEFIVNNEGLLSTFVKLGYIQSEKELLSSFANKVNKLLSEIEVYKIYYKNYKDRIQKLNSYTSHINEKSDLYWLFFGMGILVFNDKSELEREDIHKIAINFGILESFSGLNYILAINEKSIPILKEHFNNHCSRFFYIKNYRKGFPIKEKLPKIIVQRTLEDDLGCMYQEEVEGLEKFREIAADKVVLFTGIDEAHRVAYKCNKEIKFTNVAPLEILYYLELLDRNTILVSCDMSIAEELGFGSVDGFYDYSEWLREKFLEKYGNVDFSHIIKFKNNENKFLTDISASEVYYVYKGFTEAALEKHKETTFYKTIISNLSSSLEASKIINGQASAILYNRDFIRYIGIIAPELKIEFVDKEEEMDYVKKYPLLGHIHFSRLYLDIGLPNSNGIYDVNENEVYKLYRDILDYALAIERLQD